MMNDVLDDYKDVEYAEHLKNVRISEEDEALLALMNHKGGRAFIFDLFCDSGVYSHIGACGVEEANFLNGKRFIGLLVLDRVKSLCPDFVLKMEKENNG